MNNTLNSSSVLILPKMHIRNQLIKPNLRGCVIALYHLNSYLFKQQYAKLHEKIFILDVDFDQYFLSECLIQNQYSPSNFVQNQPQKLIFFHEIMHTTV